jgi:hypothetical protein
MVGRWCFAKIVLINNQPPPLPSLSLSPSISMSMASGAMQDPTEPLLAALQEESVSHMVDK